MPNNVPIARWKQMGYFADSEDPLTSSRRKYQVQTYFIDITSKFLANYYATFNILFLFSQ
jgi:hypothetical protein